eukprot:Skav224199  [mRNA]  locus=scaffold939:595316:595621:+ [translate_table: standard]
MHVLGRNNVGHCEASGTQDAPSGHWPVETSHPAVPVSTLTPMAPPTWAERVRSSGPPPVRLQGPPESADVNHGTRCCHHSGSEDATQETIKKAYHRCRGMA